MRSGDGGGLSLSGPLGGCSRSNLFIETSCLSQLRLGSRSQQGFTTSHRGFHEVQSSSNVERVRRHVVVPVVHIPVPTYLAVDVTMEFTSRVAPQLIDQLPPLFRL